MPRAPFNQIFSFYAGPDADDPGTLRFSGPGRFVRADGITLSGTGDLVPIGWVTTESGAPRGMLRADCVGASPGVADRVGYGGLDPVFGVVYVEHVAWQGASYYRAVVAELPLPVVCPAPPSPPPAGSTCPVAFTNDGDPFTPGTYSIPLPAGSTAYVLVDATGGGHAIYASDLYIYSSLTTSCLLLSSGLYGYFPLDDAVLVIRIDNIASPDPCVFTIS